MNQPEEARIEVSEFSGLELEAAPTKRPPQTFVRLENFDQLRSGSIRKTKGLVEFVPGMTYDGAITAIKNYRRDPTTPELLIGVSTGGTIYDLETGDALASVPVANFPFVGMMEGQDGDATINYLVLTTAGFYPYKWDGAAQATIIGCTSPKRAIWIVGLSYNADPLPPPDPGIIDFNDGPPPDPLPAPATDDGIYVLVSRLYRYTYWNPVTKHESSPSGDELIGNVYGSGATDSTALPLQTEKILNLVQLNLDAVPPERGEGYTRIRIYTTRDGGQVFYLNRSVVALQLGGGAVLEADEDGSLPIVTTYFDGVNLALQTALSLGSDKLMTPTQDAALVEAGPDLNENDPPPPAIWGAIYQNRLCLVDADRPNRLVFSKTGQFQSFPPDNEFVFESDDFDQITALDGQFQQLIVGKEQATARITGTDFTDFVVAPLDPQVGFVGRRAVQHIEGSLLFWSRQGIMEWSSDVPKFYGRSVRPLTDRLPESVKLDKLCMTVDNQRGLVLSSFLDGDVPSLLIIDVSQPEPFSLYPMHAEVWGMGEVRCRLSGQRCMLLGTSDGKVFKLFDGDMTNGDFPPVAVAQTQKLPISEDLKSRKVFRRLRVEATDAELAGFYYFWQVDDLAPSLSYKLRRDNFIYGVGRQISITFFHGDPVVGPEQPFLDNFTIVYNRLGETR